MVSREKWDDSCSYFGLTLSLIFNSLRQVLFYMTISCCTVALFYMTIFNSLRNPVLFDIELNILCLLNYLVILIVLKCVNC